MPFLRPDELGWARYGNLNLPPELAAILGSGAPPSLDGHVPTDSVPLGSSNAREILPVESQGLPIGEDVGTGVPAVVVDRATPAASPPPMSAAHVARTRPEPPPAVPRRRLAAAAATRMCGECRQPGHTKRSCPVLGRAPLDFNRNAFDVQQLPPHVRRSAPAPDASILDAASHLPEAAEAAGTPSDQEGSSHASGSQSGSEQDELAAEGFEGVQWKLVYDSSLPASDTNACAPPARTHCRRRRRDGSDESSSSSDDSLAGAPEFQREQKQPHASRIPRECKTPHDFVRLLFSDAYLGDCVDSTNAAAKHHPRLKDQARFAKWKDVTREEMLVFLAVCVYLGVVKVQNRKLIWQKGGVFHQEWIRRVMTLRRFECLLNAFNCCVYWSLPDEELARRNAANCFWQVESMVEECNRRCAFHFKMGRAFSIDEAVIPWKGRHKARCYNPKKPAKYHLKKFSLNCAATGYVYCHYHYAGKDERRPVGVSASVWPIKKLLDNCPALHNKNHMCATDNWYTSAQSLSYFRRQGIHCTGTIKKGRLSVATPTRPGFPTAATFKAAQGQPKRARADCMIHYTAVDGYDAYVTSWQDKKPVLLLSSYRPSAGVCVRKVKVGRAWTQQRFFRPTVIAHYNKTMGGTDLHDQRLSTVRSTVKSRRWQVRPW